ncbi:HNH endonuclease signature motif containing protein [Micromonospora sediminicola]|uniref:HNH endonuclease signature motif containing protein n=1 Tax=Micromonospora sediminicola TaxID=946078 RepID=UPI0037AF3FF0
MLTEVGKTLSAYDRSALRRIAAGAVLDPDTGCRLWRRGTSHDGYAQVSYRGVDSYAHRVAYELLRGPVPEGLQLDHLCRVRHCVNPDHLQPVTHRVNTLRGDGPTAINAAKSHCDNGHEFTAESTYRHRGRRQCRICNREAARRYKARLSGGRKA